MRSTIKIELNFDEGNLPVIEIISIYSDDVRDKLISNFLQNLSHTSRWCKILYMGNASIDPIDPKHRWHITPVKPEELEREMELMKGVIERWKDPVKAPHGLVN